MQSFVALTALQYSAFWHAATTETKTQSSSHVSKRHAGGHQWLAVPRCAVRSPHFAVLCDAVRPCAAACCAAVASLLSSLPSQVVSLDGTLMTKGGAITGGYAEGGADAARAARWDEARVGELKQRRQATRAELEVGGSVQ